MNKIILSLAVSLGLVLAVKADTTTVTITGTNYVQALTAPAVITGYSLTASTNAQIGLIDSPTNLPTYSIPAYTNILSYNTNVIVRWTNYFGVVNSWTNMSQVDITNSVAASTGTYNRKAVVATASGTTTTVAPTYMVVDNGLWVTNYTTNTAVLTIQYRQ